MSLGSQILWLLCGVGAVVFASGGRAPLRHLGIGGGLALAVWMARTGLQPDTTSVAMVAMAAAGWRIYRPEESTSAKLFGGFAGGVLAGVLAILLKAEGAPALLGWSAVGILLAATALLAARNANFAPGEVLEESHLLILALAFASAVIPALADGWRSAGALNAAAEAAAATLPAWVFLATTLFVFFGGLWSLWRHR